MTAPQVEEEAAARGGGTFFAERASLNQLARIVVGGLALAERGNIGPTAEQQFQNAVADAQGQYDSPLAQLMLLAVFDYLGMEEQREEQAAELAAEPDPQAAEEETAAGQEAADGEVATEGAETEETADEEAIGEAAMADAVAELEADEPVADQEAQGGEGEVIDIAGGYIDAARGAMAELYLQNEPLSEEQLESLQDTVGFIGNMARWRSLMLLGEEEAAEELRERVSQEAFSFFIGFVIVAAVGLFLLLLGTLLLILFVVFWSRGELRPHFTEASAFHPQIWFETFTLYLALTLVIGYVSSVLARGGEVSLGYVFVSQLLALALLAYPVVAGRSSFRGVRSDIGLTSGPWRIGEPLIGPVGYIAGLPLVAMAIILTSIVVRLAGWDVAQGMHPIVPQIAEEDAPVGRIVMLFTLAVVTAPLIEEIMFRGVLYRVLRSRMTAVPAIAISAALFAAIHPQGLIGFPLLLTVGVLLAALREWRNSLIAPIVAHACVNGVTMTIVLLAF